MPPPARASRGILLGILALAWTVVVPGLPARAATFTVTVAADSGDGVCDSHCSFREAVSAANAAAGEDTIFLPAGTFTITLGPADEDLNAGGDLDVLDAVTITGAGAGTTVLDAGGIDRGLEVLGVEATISGLTVRGGTTTLDGGGIRTAGKLTLRGMDIMGNRGVAGGGIAIDTAQGILDAANMTVRENAASTGGGGINAFDGQVLLDGVTLSKNTADMVGGGMLNEGGNAQLTNVTFSGNAANEDGGGLRTISGGTSMLNNVTVRGNTADADGSSSGNGGGIVTRDGGMIEVANSIVAGNTDVSGEGPDCSQGVVVGPELPGIITSGGFNIIGDGTGCDFVSASGDRVGTAGATIDPRLGPLADNGGPTQTHALLRRSPALEAGSPAPPGSGGSACAAGDQRGAPRKACDIGAYERVLCRKVIVNRVGTDGNDALNGTKGSDGFLAQGGNDRVRGRGGKDAACLGAGNDKGSGGGGKDLLRGDKGKDTLRGQGGNDRLRGGPGKDTCAGGPGRDRASCEIERTVP
jgi:CSLREA domain-containing protein